MRKSVGPDQVGEVGVLPDCLVRPPALSDEEEEGGEEEEEPELGAEGLSDDGGVNGKSPIEGIALERRSIGTRNVR